MPTKRSQPTNKIENAKDAAKGFDAPATQATSKKRYIIDVLGSNFEVDEIPQIYFASLLEAIQTKDGRPLIKDFDIQTNIAKVIKEVAIPTITNDVIRISPSGIYLWMVHETRDIALLICDLISVYAQQRIDNGDTSASLPKLLNLGEQYRKNNVIDVREYLDVDAETV